MFILYIFCRSARTTTASRRWSANLRRHAVTDVQDGDVVRVRPLVHTQTRPHAVPQLHNQRKIHGDMRRDEIRRESYYHSERVSFALCANGLGVSGARLVFVHKAELLITLIQKATAISTFLHQPESHSALLHSGIV